MRGRRVEFQETIFGIVQAGASGYLASKGKGDNKDVGEGDSG